MFNLANFVVFIVALVILTIIVIFSTFIYKIIIIFCKRREISEIDQNKQGLSQNALESNKRTAEKKWSDKLWLVELVEVFLSQNALPLLAILVSILVWISAF